MGVLAAGTVLVTQLLGLAIGDGGRAPQAVQTENTGPDSVPPTSMDHLGRRRYVIDNRPEMLQVIARAIHKMPPYVRDGFPSVIVVGSFDDRRFQKSDPLVEAFVIPGDPDHIYVTRWGNAFRAAAKGHEIELDGTLAHESWHLQNGPDEGAAYDYQLRVLKELHAPVALLDRVRQAKANAVYTQDF
jgi:hypothetical protein